MKHYEDDFLNSVPQPNNSRFFPGFLTGVLVTLSVCAITVSAGMGTGRLRVAYRGSKNTNPATKVDNSGELDFDRIENKAGMMQELVSQYFLFDEDMEKVEEGIYAGMMNGLGDPYTTYYTKEEYKALNEETDGQYSGIGAVVNQNPTTKIITIVKVFAGSPAAQAGMQQGDIIYKIDGEDISGEDMDVVVKTKIRGLDGTAVNITVLRGEDHKEVELNITRRNIEVPTVETKFIGEGIGYLAVSQFDGVTAAQFQKGIEDLQRQGMNKLIIDLRGNPGGLLDQVVDMLDYILPEGLVVYTADKDGNGDKYYSDEEHQLKIPMVVLVNGDSASASEVFTAAFRDFHWGKVLGTKTFGKGIVQSVIPLGDETAIKITTMHYYPPSGYDLHGVGVEPDEEVEMKEGAAVGTDGDSQLQAAISELKSWQENP